jgi:hypothetical protein
MVLSFIQKFRKKLLLIRFSKLLENINQIQFFEILKQYFDIGGLRCFILRPIKSRFGSYQGTWQATEMWQSPLAA